jgi:spore germination cell wall hydrolase CwlJ-like protein
MRYIFLSLAFVPALTIPGELQMCYRDKAAEYRERQEKCLATMVYGESRGEAYTGKVGVAYTAVNRAANTSICDVILRPKQYSIFNDNIDLRLAAMSPTILPSQKNEIDNAGWQESLKVARLVLSGKVTDPTEGATHYLAPKVMKSKKYKYPKWSKQYTLVAVIDNHRFYKPVDKHRAKT